MAIGWLGEDARRVEAALLRHPFESGRCAEAAREVLPLARCLDVGAAAMKLRPASPARYVVPRGRPAARPFYHHVTVYVRQHHVDSLTGPPGSPAAVYFIEEQLGQIAVSPELWGGLEAVEFQLLQLLELEAALSGREGDRAILEAWQRHVRAAHRGAGQRGAGVPPASEPGAAFPAVRPRVGSRRAVGTLG